MPDHVHLCLSIPPKYSMAHAIGFLKGKSAVRIHRELLHERRMTDLHFWAAGYCVSTVGLDEARVRQYIREQEELERRQGELNFEYANGPSGAFPTSTPPKSGTSRRRPPWGGHPNTSASGRAWYFIRVATTLQNSSNYWSFASFSYAGIQAPRSLYWRSKSPAQFGGIEASGSCHNGVVTTD